MGNIFETLTKAIKHWYIPLIIGVLFILMGIYVFTVPYETYASLSVVFSISFIIAGLLECYFAYSNRETLSGWGWYLTGGILTTALGAFLVYYPGVSMTILPFVVGFTMMFRSFQLLGFSLDLKELGVINWGNLAVASVLGIILSFLMVIYPSATGLSLVAVTGLTFIVVGAGSVALSTKLKKVKDYPEKLSSDIKSKLEAVEKEFRKQTAAA